MSSVNYSSKRQSKVVPRKKLVSLLARPEIESWGALMSAFQHVYRQLERALMAEDCTIPRFQIMFYLYFEGPLPAVAIAKKLFVTRGNISMFFRRLQTDGIIHIYEKDKASKRPRYCLTKKGITFFEGLFPRHVKRVRGLVPPLTKDMIAVLKKVAKGELMWGFN